MWLGTTSRITSSPVSQSRRNSELAAEFVGDAGRVDHVVAVGRAGGGLEHGGEVEVRDAEIAQIGDQRPSLREVE